MVEPLPQTRYAKSGDVNIAYQVVGDGPFDVVYVPGAFSHVELGWRIPIVDEWNRRMASFCRLILFDKRGTGMSDRTDIADLETRMDDVRAVMDAAGSERAALIGVSEGGPMSVLFAATYPDRCWALSLVASFARGAWAPDYPHAPTEADTRREEEEMERALQEPTFFTGVARGLAPSGDAETIERIAEMLRHSGTPGARIALHRMNREIDVRNVLPTIRVPTLVLTRRDDDAENVEGSRYLAARIPGARYVELDGADHMIQSGDADAALSELRTFLEAAWETARDPVDHDTVLATVLFTDIVDSTARMAELGNRKWRELLEAHNAAVRRQLLRFRGTEMDTAGDGFFARFDGPVRAVRCAQAVIEDVRALGLEVRAGVHTGECEVADGKVAGIAVSIGARVAAQAGAGEVLVSGTVRDLVAGSGLAFEDRGVSPLKGVPGEWRLYSVAGD
ncbi:MAG TPA: adenylate/guanylate cyclase domain-containing protein [Gaiellaceae bacterium]